jgi:hypothetical protein
MKLAQKPLDNVIQFRLKTQKPKVAKNILQLLTTLAALYVANDITVDIWRYLTGH